MLEYTYVTGIYNTTMLANEPSVCMYHGPFTIKYNALSWSWKMIALWLFGLVNDNILTQWYFVK